MAAQLDSAKLPVRAIITLPAIFASGSLMIAIIGQYAVVAFSMRRRTRDFGVRMALGASSQHILSSVLGEGMRLTVVGQAYAEAAEGYKYFLRFRDLDRDAVGGMVLLRGSNRPVAPRFGIPFEERGGGRRVNRKTAMSLFAARADNAMGNTVRIRSGTPLP